ncbi:uncharacterized protein LOC131857666 [Cryptomeria japonica]|uniref:uncharacterized protein LOC131857666 n=1 Tax=Cryptomeria japonica TaxID=3369 RepID=UPI0027D9D110|nr:uncharacterized protein LOC131857666 [Cryptomeria japonica]
METSKNLADGTQKTIFEETKMPKDKVECLKTFSNGGVSGGSSEGASGGGSKDLSKKEKTKGKRKRIVVDFDLSDFEDESFDEKFIKRKKGNGVGKQTQRNKNTRKSTNKVKRQILISSDEDAEVDTNDNMKGKEEDEIPDEDHGEDMSTQGVHNEGQENKMGNPSDCHEDNDGIKGFCETISKMEKDISNLKTDLNVIKNATIGEKPLSENVKELVVVINNAEDIEAMVGKIIEIEKKVKELEGNREVRGKHESMCGEYPLAHLVSTWELNKVAHSENILAHQRRVGLTSEQVVEDPTKRVILEPEDARQLNPAKHRKEVKIVHVLGDRTICTTSRRKVARWLRSVKQRKTHVKIEMVKDSASLKDPMARSTSRKEDACQISIAKWRKPGGAQVASQVSSPIGRPQ